MRVGTPEGGNPGHLSWTLTSHDTRNGKLDLPLQLRVAVINDKKLVNRPVTCAGGHFEAPLSTVAEAGLTSWAFRNSATYGAGTVKSTNHHLSNSSFKCRNYTPPCKVHYKIKV